MARLCSYYESTGGRHQRGLGHIQVDGLGRAIDNPTPSKKCFYWNHHFLMLIVSEGACRTQRRRITVIVRLRMSYRVMCWLTTHGYLIMMGICTNQVKFPLQAARRIYSDERLAPRMKKDEVGELAEKTGVPIELIRDRA